MEETAVGSDVDFKIPKQSGKSIGINLLFPCVPEGRTYGVINIWASVFALQFAARHCYPFSIVLQFVKQVDVLR